MSASIFVKQQKITNISSRKIYFFNNTYCLQPNESVIIPLNESYDLRLLAMNRKIFIEYVDQKIGEVKSFEFSTPLTKFDFIND
jgi:hypothetical protein